MLGLMLAPVRPYIESSSPRRLPGLESLARNRTAAAAAAAALATLHVRVGRKPHAQTAPGLFVRAARFLASARPGAG